MEDGARCGLVRAVDIIEYLLWSGAALASQTTSTSSIDKERCVAAVLRRAINLILS
jgi:hypothetical protein